MENEIKLQNLKLYCRTCLKKLGVLRYAVNNFTVSQFNLFTLFVGSRSLHKELYPDFICDHCHEQLKNLEKFQVICLNSKDFLENILTSTNYVDIQKFEAGLTDPLKVKTETIDTDAITLSQENKLNEITLHENKLDCSDVLKEPEEALSNGDICLDAEDILALPNRVFNTLKSLDEVTTFTRESNEEKPNLETIEEAQSNSSEIKINSDDESTKDWPSKTCSLVIGSGKRKISSRNRKTDIMCTVCFRSLSSNTVLKRHMITHLEKRPFQCIKCDRGFNLKKRLQKHVDEFHTDNPKEIVCTFTGCEKVFYHKETAANHYRRIHIFPLKGLKPKAQTHICEDCGKIFKNITSLKEHRYQHLPFEERPYACEQCSKRFTAKHHLQVHLLRHSGVKNYECCHCGSKFVSGAKLRTHINTHTKEKQWKCELCSKNFPSSGNLKRHKEVVHQGIRKYSCRYCDQSFGKPDTLKYHEMRHTGEKPYKCESCDRSFIQPVALKTHMKTHNKVLNKNK